MKSISNAIRAMITGSKSSYKQSNKQHPRHLQFEPLESRELLSVNIQGYDAEKGATMHDVYLPDSAVYRATDQDNEAITLAASNSGTTRTFGTYSGGGLDVYTNGKITFDININLKPSETIDLTKKAKLQLRVWDVDQGTTTEWEWDGVSVNGHNLGFLTGANNSWSACSFRDIDTNWLKPGKNTVTIDIDIYHAGWLVECDWGELTLDVKQELSFHVETETEYKIPTVGEDIKLEAKFDEDISKYTVIETEWTVIDKKTGRTDWAHTVNGSLEDTYVAQKNPDPYVLSISGMPAYGEKIINCTVTLKDANGNTITLKSDPKDENSKIIIDRLMPMDWIAHDWAYHPGGVKVGGNSGFNGYTVDLKINNWATSMDAYGLIRETSDGKIEKSLLVFRGTQEIFDIVVDLNINGVGESQYAFSRSTIISWAQRVSKEGTISVTGHSLGGALAQYFAADWTLLGGRIDTLETFQSAGIRQIWAQSFRPSNCSRSIHHIAAGDIVSLTGSFVSGQYLVHPTSFTNAIDAHTWSGLSNSSYVLMPSFSNPGFSYGSYAGNISTENMLARCDALIQNLQQSTSWLKDIRILALDIIKIALSNRASLEYLRSHAFDLGIGGMAILANEFINVITTPQVARLQSTSADQISQTSFSSFAFVEEVSSALHDYELPSGWKVSGQTLTDEGIFSGFLTPPEGFVPIAFTLDLNQENSVMQINGSATYPLTKNTFYFGNTLDLSNAFDTCIVGDTVTTYIWKFQNGTNVDPNKITITETGKFAFDSSLVGQKVYCVMTNGYLNGFTLTTSTFEITNIAPPILSAPEISTQTSSSTSINVTWKNVTNCNNYVLLYSTNSDFEEVSTREIADIASNSFSITGLIPNTTYYVRVKAVGSNGYEDSAYSVVKFSKTAVSPIAVTVLGSNTQDTDSNSLFDALIVNTKINTSIAGAYRINASLHSETGEIISTVTLSKNLANGNNIVDFLFKGTDIFYSGFDGPYTLKIIIAPNQEFPVFSEDNLYQTTAYDHLQFEGGWATFSDMFSDYTKDIDGNGKFDALTIDIGVNIKRAGEYEMIGYLADTDGNFAGYCSVITTLGTGEQTVSLDFDSLYLNTEGPWTLSWVMLRDVKTGVSLCSIEDVYTTDSYNNNDFQSGGVRFNGTNSEFPVDEDGDGKYNYIDIQFGINVTVPGDYTFSSLILDVDGNIIGSHEQINYLEAGLTSIIVKLDSRDFSSGKFDGPYHLVDISLYNDLFELVAVSNSYTTHEYHFSDFDSQTVFLEEEITDSLVKNYNHNGLGVNFSILVENSGLYNINARLLDIDGNEVSWASVETYLIAEQSNSIQLLFTRNEIYAHGVAGPYYVTDFSIYSMYGYDDDSLFLLDVHETAAYSLSDFAPQNTTNSIIALAADAGPLSKPIVQVYNADTEEFLFEITADRTFGENYTGGVRVATGDLNSDGVPDIAVVPGRSMAPSVLVFNGVDGSLLENYCIPASATYGMSFKDGLHIAIGDVVGNGMNDIILVPSGGQAVVKVFENITDTTSGTFGFSNHVARQFNAFEDYKQFIGGGSIAVGNTETAVTSNDKSQIVIGTGAGIVPMVRVFDIVSNQTAYKAIREVTSVHTDVVGGINIAIGDLNGDGYNELIVASKNGGRSWVDLYKLYPEKVPQHVAGFQAFGPTEGNNVTVNLVARDTDNDGLAEIIVTQGAKGKAGFVARKFQVNSLESEIVDEIFAEWSNPLATGLFIG